jgi:hypothetical protein
MLILQHSFLQNHGPVAEIYQRGGGIAGNKDLLAAM